MLLPFLSFGVVYPEGAPLELRRAAPVDGWRSFSQTLHVVHPYSSCTAEVRIEPNGRPSSLATSRCEARAAAEIERSLWRWRWRPHDGGPVSVRIYFHLGPEERAVSAGTTTRMTVIR